ncbi:GDSL esterase/lipase EXL3 [Cocos nucifera]|uniref:GDSL esterase/lipase EXL3 n=1 Tax=Cocos nucifera TaxID=13894 RepID=A0A8K0ILC1_COCNU|nr:GDSL esterase/lipase EXL3 [Cocos nucifera]
MAAFSSSTALPILVLLLQLILLAQAHSSNRTTNVTFVLFFGDSIMDTGNNNGLLTVVKSNFHPYGQDFAGHQATGRFSNGKIATDLIASKLGVKERVPPYLGSKLGAKDLLTGVSFASAGTGYDPITAIDEAVIPMQRQLEMFKEYKENLKSMVGEERARNTTSKILYIVCAGSNDVVTYFLNPLRRLGYDIPGYAEFLKQTASSFVQDLVNLGAKLVGVLGAPPMGCLPMQRTLGGGASRDCAADLNKLAQAYNSKLSGELQSLTSKNPGTKLVYIDIYSPLLDLIQNPQKYGKPRKEKNIENKI